MSNTVNFWEVASSYDDKSDSWNNLSSLLMGVGKKFDALLALKNGNFNSVGLDVIFDSINNDTLFGTLSEKYIFNLLKRNKDVFVETGTETGRSVMWAHSFFKKLYTCEIHKALFDETFAKFRGEMYGNVFLYNGESIDFLSNIRDDINTSSCFFWLDAHWSGGSSPKGKVSVPLVEELSEIKKYKRNDNVIVIDDYRLFSKEWVGLVKKNDVLDKIYEINENYKIVLYHDTLVAAVENDFRFSEYSNYNRVLYER